MRTKSNGSQAARTPVSTWTKALLPATRGLPAPSTCLHPPPYICTAFQRIQPNSHRYIIIYIIRNAFRALIIHSVSRRRKKRTGTHCRVRMEVDRSSSCDAVMFAVEEGCSTPRHGIPARTAPPPPPRKKALRDYAEKRKSPKNGYFQPPDLDQLFAVRPRAAETCV